MNKRLLPFILICSISSICFAQNRYVDHTGANGGDGMSWPTAYKNLQMALNDPVNPDTIFVAEGTYTPDLPSGNPEATFLIANDVVLLGGHPSGGGVRNPELYPTILSGDLNSDDVDDNFTDFKSDNVRTVLSVESNVSDVTLIDGFTIRNGYAGGLPSVPQKTNSGAGMYVEGSPRILQCIFKQNYATQIGGAIWYFSYSSKPILIEDCEFEKNQSSFGGAVHLSGNPSPVGGSVQIVNCMFHANHAFEGNGGGLLLWPRSNGSSFRVSGCAFLGNAALNNAGGLYFFNEASDNLSNVSLLIDSCHFVQNSNTAFNGSGLSAGLRGENITVELSHSIFDQNTSAHFGTAFLYGLAGSGQVSVNHCTFTNNLAEHDGGLAMGTFGDPSFFDFSVTNCQFLQNEATDFCGGLEIYAAYPSTYLVEKCNFIGNKANVLGGAMLVYSETEEVEAVIKDCIMQNNSSPKGTAIGAHPIPGEAGSGAIDASFTFENCLITDNFGGEETVILKGTGSLNFMNCTIAKNQSKGIAMDTFSKVALQNTILFNPGYPEHQAIANTNDISITSNGGNLIGDLSLDTALILSDQQDQDPLFVGLDDYHFTELSPCVDAGNEEGLTAEFDLEGNDRIRGARVDVGAYESPFTVDVSEIFAGKMTVSPNPSIHFVTVQIPEANITPKDILVFDAMGSLLEKHPLNLNQEIDVRHLPSGIYFIKAMVKDKTYTGQFVKQ